MSQISQSMKDKFDYLPIDLPFGAPPSKDDDTSLAKVQLPPQWAKPSDIGSWARSVPSARSQSTDSRFDIFGPTGGDLLDDEVDQEALTAQAVQHVARLIAEAKGRDTEDIEEILLSSMVADGVGSSEYSFDTLSSPTQAQSSRQSSTHQPSRLIQEPYMNQTVAKRREIDLPPVKTGKRLRPHRPFSFLAGDDIVVESRSAPLPQEVIIRPSSQPSIIRSRSPSMIPNPVLDHPLGRPRRAEREDSSSSLITSFQRSPCEGTIIPRTPSGASSRVSAITAVRQTSGGSRLVVGLNNARNKAESGESS
jgi:hypothetical protein